MLCRGRSPGRSIAVGVDGVCSMAEVVGVVLGVSSEPSPLGTSGWSLSCKVLALSADLDFSMARDDNWGRLGDVGREAGGLDTTLVGPVLGGLAVSVRTLGVED
jgi:hypothetical protein